MGGLIVCAVLCKGVTNGQRTALPNWLYSQVKVRWCKVWALRAWLRSSFQSVDGEDR